MFSGKINLKSDFLDKIRSRKKLKILRKAFFLIFLYKFLFWINIKELKLPKKQKGFFGKISKKWRFLLKK